MKGERLREKDELGQRRKREVEDGGGGERDREVEWLKLTQNALKHSSPSSRRIESTGNS